LLSTSDTARALPAGPSSTPSGPALRYAARQVPREVLEAAWTGDPSTLDRLLGSHP